MKTNQIISEWLGECRHEGEIIKAFSAQYQREHYICAECGEWEIKPEYLTEVEHNKWITPTHQHGLLNCSQRLRRRGCTKRF